MEPKKRGRPKKVVEPDASPTLKKSQSIELIKAKAEKTPSKKTAKSKEKAEKESTKASKEN